MLNDLHTRRVLGDRRAGISRLFFLKKGCRALRIHTLQSWYALVSRLRSRTNGAVNPSRKA